MVQALVDLGAVLAQGGAEPPPGSPEFGKSSPIGLVVVLLLGLVTVLLIVSMTRRLRNLPESFEEQAADEPQGATEPAEPPSADPDPAASAADARESRS